MFKAALLTLSVSLSFQAFGQSRLGIDPPRLVVLISIDQFRADYVDRFNTYYLPAKSKNGVGGFRYLTANGADFLDAHHNHVPTATGPGHATLMTGSEPGLNGIVGNDWYDPAKIDWSSGKKPDEIYCVSDPAAEAINGGGKMSARNLKVTTVGDELKMATNGKAKVVGIAYKDRASILMAGHAADTVIWFNGAGGWASSSYFFPNGKLPSWVESFNAEKNMEKFLGKSWEPSLPNSAYTLSRKAPAEKVVPGQAFSHPYGATAEKSFYTAFTASGDGNDFVESTIERAIKAEGLGQDDVPDVLVINLSTNDYIGHRYGPNSPEVFDVSVRTDRMLSKLFNFIDKQVPGGLKQVTIALTADHGVLPIPEESADVYHTGAQRIADSTVETAVDAALSAKYGKGKWSWFSGPNLHLNHELIDAKKLSDEEVESAAAEALNATPGIYTALTKHQLLQGNIPATDFARMAQNSFFPKLSGDLLVFEAPGNYFGEGTGTGHGSPWAYDSHVPIILCGKGISRGRFSERVYTSGIAPTLCRLLGIENPTGCVGRLLGSALGK